MAKHIFQLYVYIFTILQVSCESKSCNVSKTTMVEVKRCPKTAEEWNIAASLKNCSAVHQSCVPSYEFKYHCVKNGNSTILLEVCGPVWRSAGYCVEYNEAGHILQDNYNENCTIFSKPCSRTYISTDIYKYQGCYELVTSDTPIDREKRKHSWGERITIDKIILVGVTIILSLVLLAFIMYKKRAHIARINKNAIRFLSGPGRYTEQV
ncbi:uncharacterized protein LOC134282088 [Saccostrea cucullata]|uniref:uncharacterized protein LOC134282088 n=1 Tax=Saccostrea cuccullata TaxID=36930 RepID=UPI002ECFC9DB